MANFEERKQFNGINRDTWFCTIAQPRLRKAILAKVAFHRSRVAYWTKERDKKEKEFKKAGMKLVARPQFGSTAMTYSATSAAASNKIKTAEVDYELQAEWQACNQKVEQHKALIREFERWADFFAPVNKSKEDAEALDLTFADMLYFGMVGGDTTDTGDK